MKLIIILSLILACTISNAQDRKDTISMKDGTEILCQVLRVSEPDSIIQFCIRENGELKIMKVQTAFVNSYSWPGKEQSGKYSKMLGANSIQDGEIYNGYWYIPPPAPKHEPTGTELAAKELNKASTMMKISFGVVSAGLVTAIFVPTLIPEPGIQGSNMYSYPEDYKAYENTIKTLHIVGYGVAAAGAAILISSLNHFAKARQLKKESGKGLSLSTNQDGFCMAFKF